MRLLVSLVGSFLLAVSGAQAQDWSGGYVGASITWQESQDGDVKAAVRVLRDPRLTYMPAPAAQEYVAPAFDSAAVGGVFAGWRTEAGLAVLGIEGQVQAGRSEVRFDSGRLSYSPIDSGLYTACGEASLGCLFGFSDFATGKIDIENTVSLRASAGLPIGDRALLSVYAGPSVAVGNVTLAQRSTLGIGRFPIRGVECFMFCTIPITTSAPILTAERSEDDTVTGFVGGVTLDAKVSERVLARADIGYARYEAFRLEGDATQTSLAAQHVAVTGSLGLIVRF